MKKFLSMLLAVIMIVSAAATMSFAAPAEQCAQFSDSGAYLFLQNLQIAASASTVSFDLAWEADFNGEPSLSLNVGSIIINPVSITAGGKTVSYNWGAVEGAHWRKVELAYTSAGVTISLDGSEIASFQGVAARTNDFIFIGYPGNIYIDNFKVYNGGTLTNEIDFDNEGVYLNHKSADSSTIRTTIPANSYYDYEEVILPDNVEYIFDSEADCDVLTIGSEEVILVGDVNEDNKINSRDILKLKRLTVNGEDFDVRLADFDFNGSVNAKDSLFLKQTVSGKRDPVEKTYGSAEAVPFEATQQSAKLTASETAADGIDVTLNMDAIDPASYPFAVITYMTPASEADKNSDAAIESAFGAYGNLISYELETNGKYHAAIVDLSEISTWNGDKATLKFFTAANEGDTLYLDSIVFVATQARANAVKDAREAAKRTYGIYDQPETSGLGEYMGESYLVNFDSEAKMDYVSVGNNSRVSYDANENAVKAQVTGGDPSVYVDLSSEGISADTYKYIVYTYYIPTTSTKEGPKANMYYVCGNIDVPTGGYECDVFQCTKGSKFVTYVVDLSAKSNWNGDIKGLRIDYFTDAPNGDVAYIDSLVFCKTLGEANTAARLRLEDRYGVAQVDTAGVWNTYWNYYMNANNYEFIAGSASNLQMYFRFNPAKLTARSLGDRFARAITNATGYEVTCEVYAGYFDLKNNGASNVKYILTYKGESYIVWLYTNIIYDSSYSDALDGTSEDVEPSYPNLGTWGVSVSDLTSFPQSNAMLSFHSNHETRLVSTPYGDFAVLPMSENSSSWGTIGGANFTLFRIYDNGTTKALGNWDFAYHTSKPNIFYNKNDGLVYVVCTDDQGSYMSNLVLYFDPSNENYNIQGGRTNVSYQGGAAPSGYGYIQPILDETNNKIYALACGGKDAGYFGWGIYNCKSKSWEGSKFSTVLDTYRHCYVYGFSDGNKGFYVVAGRDVLLSTLGLAGTVYGADYAWDEVNLFHFPSAYSTGYTRTTVIPADYTQMARSLFPSACNNNAGDTYITTDGKLHVLGAKAMHGNFHHDGKYDEMWHAVYDVSTPGMKPAQISNYPISFGNPDIGYSMRMAEDTKGGVYIVAMPKANSCRAEIWKATDENQTKFEIVGCKGFPVDIPTNSFIIANGRNGSVIDGKIGCFFPVSTGNGWTYKYFTVQVD